MHALRPALLFCLIATTAQAQSVVPTDSTRATLVLFRDRGTDPLAFTGRFSYGIWVNDKRVCTIDPQRYLLYSVEPGPVRIRAGRRALFAFTKNELRLDAEAGGIYYIAGTAHALPNRSWLLLHRIPERVALPRLANLRPDGCTMPVQATQHTNVRTHSSGEGY